MLGIPSGWPFLFFFLSSSELGWWGQNRCIWCNSSIKIKILKCFLSIHEGMGGKWKLTKGKVEESFPLQPAWARQTPGLRFPPLLFHFLSVPENQCVPRDAKSFKMWMEVVTERKQISPCHPLNLRHDDPTVHFHLQESFTLAFLSYWRHPFCSVV